MERASSARLRLCSSMSKVAWSPGASRWAGRQPAQSRTEHPQQNQEAGAAQAEQAGDSSGLASSTAGLASRVLRSASAALALWTSRRPMSVKLLGMTAPRRARLSGRFTFSFGAAQDILCVTPAGTNGKRTGEGRGVLANGAGDGSLGSLG